MEKLSDHTQTVKIFLKSKTNIYVKHLINYACNVTLNISHSSVNSLYYIIKLMSGDIYEVLSQVILITIILCVVDINNNNGPYIRTHIIIL